MERKILLPIDDSAYSNRAIAYVAAMFARVEDFKCTLFHVQPTISQYLLDEARTDAKANAELKKMLKKNAERARGIIEKNKERIVRMGVSEDRVETMSGPKRNGLAKDILDIAQEKRYDAILVGRRGLSRVQKAFMGSVSANLLTHSGVIPVWVIDGEATSRKILVAVDGSECAIRVVDHLGHIFGGCPDIQFTLFHVAPTTNDFGVPTSDQTTTAVDDIIRKGDRRLIDTFFSKARNLFEAAGIENSQIDIKMPKRRGKVGKMIIDETDKGGYGTVVVGRRGVNQAFFFGSVSKFVAERITDRALWLVP